jgi:hypothetical protein
VDNLPFEVKSEQWPEVSILSGVQLERRLEIKTFRQYLRDLRKKSVFVEYDGHPELLKKQGCLYFSSEGRHNETATVISPLESRSMYTTDIFRCAALAALGESGGRPFALLAHLYPAHIVRAGEQSVRDALVDALSRFNDITEPTKRSFFLAGTHKPLAGSGDSTYILPIISQLVKKHTEHEPVILGEPTANPEEFHEMLVDTDQKKIILLRWPNDKTYRDSCR